MPDLTPLPPFEEWPPTIRAEWDRLTRMGIAPVDCLKLMRFAFEWGQRDGACVAPGPPAYPFFDQATALDPEKAGLHRLDDGEGNVTIHLPSE